MNEKEFTARARRLVYNFAASSLDPTDATEFTIEGVYFISFNYVLGNCKAFLSTVLPDGMYYEVVYSLPRDEMHLIAYKRWQQLTMAGEDAKQ